VREIIFRGKTVCDGDWIYGGITWNPSKKKVFIHTEWDEGEVIPETVGQYTGLCDKNGTKIFEGDILSAHLDDGYPENETMLEVVWHNNGWYGKNGKFFDDFDNGFEKYFEVIGNIHDKSKLLNK